MKLARRRSNVDREGASGNDPALGDDVPDRDVLHTEGNGELGGLALLDELTLETTEHTRRLAGAGGEAEVQLRDFVTVDGASVLDGEGRGESRRPETRVAAGLGAAGLELGLVLFGGAEGGLELEFRVGEGRVAQTESKLVTRLDVVDVEPAVIDVYERE